MPSLGIYVHIPFCISKCPYCDFNSYVRHPLPEDRYTSALVSQLRLVSKERFSDYHTVDTVYFGGGTPSLFSPRSIEKVLSAIASCYCLSDGAEITLEANPRTLTPTKLKELLTVGVNRLNLGLQSLEDRLLGILGRVHSAQDASRTFRSARDAGFDNLGVDLMFGIPSQVCSELEGDLEKVIELQPEHIAAYNLTIEPGTPYCHWTTKGTLTLPSEEEQVTMYGLAREYLCDAGYEHYEISNFSLPEKRSRHNQKYWMLNPYLGIGAGAHSYHPGSGGHALRWWNVADPLFYSDSIERGESSIAGEESLDKSTTLKESLFLGLRKMEGISFSDYKVRFDMDRNDPYARLFHDLAEEGLLEVTHNAIKLTSRGVLLADEVFQNFF